MKITLTFEASDIEPILRRAATDAARYSAYVDYFTKRTGNLPLAFSEKNRAEWRAQFLRAKRIVEAFGVEYEQTSEAETLTVGYPWVGGKTRRGELGFNITTGSVQDFKNPFPSYRREVHSQACYAAAERVVRRWWETLL